MAKRVARDGWVSWSAVQGVARGVVTPPVTAGFIMLGAGVMLGRALIEFAGEVWPWTPTPAPTVPPAQPEPKA